MNNGRWQAGARGVTAITVIVVLVSLPRSAPLTPWQVYAFRSDSFTLLPASSPPVPSSPPPLVVPDTWHVTASTLTDVTGDDIPEWVLLVWRPWRDWPIQRWLSVPSPIADFYDAAGDSCHLILLDPHDGREIWAGSALPAPLLALEFNMPTGVTDTSQSVFNLHMTIFYICLAIAVVVFGVMMWSIYHHRKSRGHEAAQFHGNILVEVIWTTIPFLILVAIAIPSTITLGDLYDASESDIDIQVTGHQWKWHYKYIGEDVDFFSVLATPR